MQLDSILLLGLGLASAVALPHNEFLNGEMNGFALRARFSDLAPPPAKSTAPVKPNLPPPTPRPSSPKSSPSLQPPKLNPPTPAPKPSPPKPNSSPPLPSPRNSRSFTTIKASPEAWKSTPNIALTKQSGALKYVIISHGAMALTAMFRKMVHTRVVITYGRMNSGRAPALSYRGS